MKVPLRRTRGLSWCLGLIFGMPRAIRGRCFVLLPSCYRFSRDQYTIHLLSFILDSILDLFFHLVYCRGATGCLWSTANQVLQQATCYRVSRYRIRQPERRESNGRYFHHQRIDYRPSFAVSISTQGCFDCEREPADSAFEPAVEWLRNRDPKEEPKAKGLDISPRVVHLQPQTGGFGAKQNRTAPPPRQLLREAHSLLQKVDKGWCGAFPCDLKSIAGQRDGWGYRISRGRIDVHLCCSHRRGGRRYKIHATWDTCRGVLGC